MDVELARATRADVPAMHAIRLRVRENLLSDPGSMGHDAYLPYLGETWTARYNGTLAGFGAHNRGSASIWALFVAPECVSMGLGRALLDRLVERAIALKLDSLNLTTTPGTHAEQFYRRQGWQSAGTAPNGEVMLRRLLAPLNAGRSMPQ